MKVYLNWEDIRKVTGLSRSQAYRVIAAINEAQTDKGFQTIRGKVSKKVFCRDYDLTPEEVDMMISQPEEVIA